MLTLEELDALDNWRFAHRMPSRAASVWAPEKSLSGEGFIR